MASVINYSVTIFYIRKTQYQGLGFLDIEFLLAENITLDKWIIDTNQPRFDKKRWQYIYPFFSIDTDILTQAEETYLSKWWQPASEPRWDKKRQQYTYPSSFHYVEEEPFEPFVDISEWFVNTNIPDFARAILRKSKPHFYPSFVVNQDPFFVRARGLIRGFNKDTNTEIGVRGHPSVGLNKDTNTPVGTRKI